MVTWPGKSPLITPLLFYSVAPTAPSFFVGVPTIAAEFVNNSRFQPPMYVASTVFLTPQAISELFLTNRRLLRGSEETCLRGVRRCVPISTPSSMRAVIVQQVNWWRAEKWPIIARARPEVGVVELELAFNPQQAHNERATTEAFICEEADVRLSSLSPTRVALR